MATAELGRRIRDLRKELGYSQEAFAEVVGVDRSYMGIIERGEQNLTLHTIMKVALALEVDLCPLVAHLPNANSDAESVAD